MFCNIKFYILIFTIILYYTLLYFNIFPSNKCENCMYLRSFCNPLCPRNIRLAN